MNQKHWGNPYSSRISVLDSFTKTNNPSKQDLQLNVPSEGQINYGKVSCLRTCGATTGT